MKELKEFDVIGNKIKLSASSGAGIGEISADAVVDLVNEEALKIKIKNQSIDDGQLATLTALKIASDILRMEKDFRDNIYSLQGTANEALGYIKEISSNSTQDQK